jgi:hypothetical protein
LLVFGDHLGNIPDRLLTNNWKEIGFQNQNPRTDFRGGGLLSLNCLKYFVKKYPDVFKQMLISESRSFYIALSSINVTVNTLSDNISLIAFPDGVLLTEQRECA